MEQLRGRLFLSASLSLLNTAREQQPARRFGRNLSKWDEKFNVCVSRNAGETEDMSFAVCSKRVFKFVGG